MEDVIRVHNQFYILATASRSSERTAVLKHDDTFALFDYAGDIGALGTGEQGLYHEGTRYLSRFRLRVNGHRPLLLSARVKQDNELFGSDLTNPDLPLGDGDRVLSRDLVHIFRARFLWDATWHERIRLVNYSRAHVRISLAFDIEADYADIFEVRGTTRERRGARLDPSIDGTELRLGYRGLDDEERWTAIEWSEPPTAMTAAMARFEYELVPQAPQALTIAIRCDRHRVRVAAQPYETAEAAALRTAEISRSQYATVTTSSERFDEWVRRSAADLRMLVSATPHGSYPYAGVPWFSTPFGRDGIITAFQTLWINPDIARGVLAYLAETQADRVDARQDAEPGKILHETRSSEMARVGEVPFGQYYGSIDATPLFVMLAGAYYDRSGDREFVRRIWPNVERALGWMDGYGDRDGDGFVEYARQASSGLIQQGWKDSQDSVFHANGTPADAPIALCEVQAYVYDARLRAANLADALGERERGEHLRSQAEALRVAFEERFWCEQQSTYALALDGLKQPCCVRSSNAGHCLFGGIAAPERAARVARTLLGPEMYSGWGVRTIASSEYRYNPMSYHNGSVWPHDNGVLAAGLSRYGLDAAIAPILTGLFHASTWMEGYRLPELFCGFHRRDGEGPTLYPVACAPQAWASGVVFQLLQACLRLSLLPDRRTLQISRPILPPFLTYLRLLDVRMPEGAVDLLFEQRSEEVAVTVLDRRGDVAVDIA